MIVVILVLALAVVGLGGWALWMVGHPRVVQGPAIPIPGPERVKEVIGPERVREVKVAGPERIKEVRVIEYVRPDDIPASGIEGSQLADPRALPEAPGALPDSAVDGVRLGELTVRAGAARGAAGRGDAELRRQVAEISVLDMLSPPALLSVVAAGRRGAQFSQLGAAETARSLHTRLAARADELDDLWRLARAEDSGAKARLNLLLRAIAAAVTTRLTEVARRRDASPETVASQFTCVVSRLGDTDRRQHLAFGVGDGPVLLAASDSDWRSLADLSAHTDEYLPGGQEAAWSELAQTAHGDLLMLCTPSTARLLDRAPERARLRTALTTPPSLLGFLYELGLTHNLLSDDRAAVCIWEGVTRPAPHESR